MGSFTRPVAEYGHIERDLFAHPERYFYARCDNADFLRRWRDARARFRSALSTAADSAGEAREPARQSSGAADRGESLLELRTMLEDMLASFHGGARIDDRVGNVLPALVAKFEVFRRLFDRYQPNLSRHRDAKPAGLDDYALFALCLAQAMQRTSRLQYLSTLLKLNDALSSQDPGRFSATGRTALLTALTLEADAVDELERRLFKC